MAGRQVFVTGATGHMGRNLIPELLQRAHRVYAVVRAGSEGRLPPRCEAVVANALDGQSYAEHVPAGSTFVHLVGVTHPNPSKAQEFRDVDLKSATEAIEAAKMAGVSQFVYVSVAQPAPVMKAYIEARAKAEEAIRASGLAATILRPWYVLGPGRRWPLALLPMYWLMETIPATRERARRLGLVSIKQMVAALCAAVEDPVAAGQVRIVGVPEIRAS